ncbi:MAG: RNA-binding protein [Peptococcaceae bacterium BRH_c8a]|nr:MAG: RNA-binding protein [Peptococcaceae bacterium BRH_c8a]
MNNEHPSVLIMWENYLKSIGDDTSTTKKNYSAWHFELTQSGANALVTLVLKGTKRATASSLWSYKYDRQSIPKEGDHSVITDWNGNAKCIVKTIKVQIILYKEITEEMAQIEGEGDLSLEYWKRVHDTYFIKECMRLNKHFTDEMPVVFEEFEVVYK